jgi:DNA-directed RNA polymerase sigma subunit (sigma70/sigma32)
MAMDDKEFLDSIPQETFSVLDDRQRHILRLRFALDDEPRRHTLAEVGELLQLSRPRVLQIQNTALLKLRRRISSSTRRSG